MEFNQDQAFAEGWCVSCTIGSSYFPENWLNIERLDGNTLFLNDFEAVAHVFKCASDGSDYHREAVLYMEKNNFDMVRRVLK